MKYIKLNHNKKTKVDDEDYEFLIQFRWFAENHAGRWRVFANVRRDKYLYKRIFMHQLLIDCPEGMVLDHINGNPLDNRKVNLRTCDKAQNCQNRVKNSNNEHKYKGYTYVERYCNKPWKVTVCYKGKRYWGGIYATEEEAGRAYDILAKKLFGDFANLNFPKHKDMKTYSAGYRAGRLYYERIVGKTRYAEKELGQTGLSVACLRIDCSEAQQHVKECVAYGKPYPGQTRIKK